ncbi:MAG: gfo/Idh/MocA family oxidoreductase, partial [Acidobacteriota bacterium]|nr:gfo/Idh/MocA family oxidoreductase [Acidobacteriota bacterium]
CIANITASRISREQIRKVRFFQAGAYLSIDYAAQEVDAWRLVKSGQAPASIEGGQMDVKKEEPLRLELLDFVSAVRHHRAPEVTGEDGRRALVLAQRITDQMKVRE